MPSTSYNSRQFHAGNFAWIDLETSGLYPGEDGACILECALIVTNSHLRELHRHSWLLEPLSDENTWHPTVVKMHTESGLFNDIVNADHLYNHADVEEELYCALRQYNCIETLVEDQSWRSPLCGSTPQFDRNWMDFHMRKVTRALSYRNFDVSSWYYPCQYFGIPGLPEAGAPKHRAMDDISWSLNTFRQTFNRVASCGQEFNALGMKTS